MSIVNGYSTLVTVKTSLSIPLDNNDEDYYLEATIEAVSRMIDNYTGRRFYSEQDTRYYAAASIDEVFIDDLLSLTSIKTDDDNDGVFETTWSTADYHKYPLNAGENGTPYTRIEVSGYGSYSFPTGVKRAVQIVGTFGYCSTAAIPKPVSEACKLQASRLYKRKDAPFGVIGGGDMQQSVSIPDIDQDVKILLSPYIRRM